MKMGPASQASNQLAETLVNELTEEEKGAILAYSFPTIRSKMSPEGKENLKKASLTIAQGLAEKSIEIEPTQQRELIRAIVSKIAERIDQDRLAIHETVSKIIENLAGSEEELERVRKITKKVKEELWDKLTVLEQEAVRTILIKKKPIKALTEEEKKALAQINIKATALDIDSNQIRVLLAKFAGGE